MAPFNRRAFRFDCQGVDINAPVDALPPGYYPILENLRPEIDGSVSPRPGLGTGTQAVAAISPVHSLKRINDSSLGGGALSTEIVGTGIKLATMTTALAGATERDSGYSGSPLSIMIAQPRQAIKPYAYIADSSRMRKLDRNGSLKNIGLAPPTTAPTVRLGTPYYNIIDELDDSTQYTAAGTAAALANVTRVNSASRTITAIVYDIGSTAWCCIMPSSMADIGRGMRLTISGTTETVTVQDVFRGSGSSTIAYVLYESGTTGICSMHLATPFAEIETDAMLQLSGGAGTEYVRVLSVHPTKDGLTSIRCSTTLARAIGDTVQAQPSFRAYTVNTHSATQTLSAIGVTFTVATGTGTISRTLAVDISSIGTGLPTQPDDEMHVSIYVDKPELISEIKTYLDIDSSTNDFTRNYFFHSIRSNDLTPVTKGTQTVIQNRQLQLQRGYVDRTARGGKRDDMETYFEDNGDPFRVILPKAGPTPEDPNPTTEDPDRSKQTDAGQNQWAEIRFRISELLAADIGRVGSDGSRGLKNVAALRFGVVATGAVVISVDSWWAGGGYGPDVAADHSYLYRFRGRDSATGAVSNYGPSTLGGVRPYRQSVSLFFDQQGGDCDKLDVQRYGGPLLGWHYQGTVDNGAFAQSTDTWPDSDLDQRSTLSDGNTHYQLWPIRTGPKSGVCEVAGNLIKSGTAIDITTAPGTAIRIGGQEFTIHRMVSTTLVYLTESAGSSNSAVWEMLEPTIQGQPLQILSQRPFFGFYFGLGDQLNPGRLYYTNADDPDSTDGDYFIDVTNAGEPLQNVCILGEDRALLWSTERMFSIEPAFTTGGAGGNLFVARAIPSGIGLFYRWGLCLVEDTVVFAARDGLYETSGGACVSITKDLRKIFGHEGSTGVISNGFYPPDPVQYMQLAYADGELYFNYQDTGGAARTIVRTKIGGAWSGWRPYLYSPGARCHYSEEGQGIHGILVGGTDGKIYRLARAQADGAGAAIAWNLRTPSYDGDDNSSTKVFGDARVDYDTDGSTISVTPGFDNYGTTVAPTSLSEASGRRQRSIDLGTSGGGQRARNVALHFSGSVTTQRPSLFIWEPRWAPRPESSLLRATDYEVIEQGVKWARGLWIMADTYNSAREAVLEYTGDDGVVANIVLTGITHAVMSERYYPIPNGIYLIASRLRATDAATWELAGYRLDAEPAPPSSTQPSPWINAKGPGLVGAGFVQGVVFDIDTGGGSVDMEVQLEGGSTQTTINAVANKGPVQTITRSQRPFSFDTPFIAHLIRFVPHQNCRIFGIDIRSQPEPELAFRWEGQQMDCGSPGFKIFGDAYLTLRSTSEVTFQMYVDGVLKTLVAYDASTNSGGTRLSFRFRSPVAKGKLIIPQIFAASSSGRVAVFAKECSLQYKPWGYEGAWQWINLLGDMHNESGARI